MDISVHATELAFIHIVTHGHREVKVQPVVIISDSRKGVFYTRQTKPAVGTRESPRTTYKHITKNLILQY